MYLVEHNVLKNGRHKARYYTERHTGHWNKVPTNFGTKSRKNLETEAFQKQRQQFISSQRARLELLRKPRHGIEKSELEAVKSDLAQYYRFCLLRNLEQGYDLIAPQNEEWRHKLIGRCIDEAKELYLQVYGVDDSGVPLQCKPEFKTFVNLNPQSYPSGKYTRAARAGADGDNPEKNEVEKVLAATSSPIHVTYVADSGAARHVKNLRELTHEELKRLKTLPEPVVLTTANGVVVIDKYIEAQIQKLGAAKTLQMLVIEDSPSLLSIGKLVIDDGFKFFWEGKNPCLVSPDGEYTWLKTNNYVFELTTHETIVNKDVQ